MMTLATSWATIAVEPVLHRMQPFETQIYRMIGADGFANLVSAFYKQIPTDDILGPMYPPADLVGAETRLREFLIQRFGGPEHYSEKRGHPRLRMRHAPFMVDQRARDRWMQIMTKAMSEVELPQPVAEFLMDFFANTATFLINRK